VDKTKSDTATVTIYGSKEELPTITSVTVSPATATVGKGSTYTFTAVVAVTNGAAQTVTWSIVEAGKNAGTTIVNGVLTVAADEALTTLTVKATSTVDDTKSGTATVTISTDPANLHTSTCVTVSAASATVEKGGTQTFTATVEGTNSPAQTVTWSIVETGKKAGTTINASGVLTVAADEALTTLTVKATSTVDNTKSGTATVTISAPVGSGQYTKKDVLGNSYSISVGSNVPRASIASRYARATAKDDRVKLSVTGRNGKTRNISGKVKNISTDGTITIETDKGDEFTAVVDGNSLDSIASEGAEITFDDNSKLVPRTFDNIFLRADRWDTGNQRGEQYGSGLSVLVKDFPTNVSKFEKGAPNGRYEIKVSGTLDKALSHAQVEVHGLNENDKWIFLAQNYEQISISAGSFNTTIKLDVDDDPDNTGKSYNLMDYKEVILQFVERVNYFNDNHADWNQNYGTIPAEIPDGQIVATISNFKISLIDTNRYAFKGNTDDYTYGYKEDGFSINYNLAVWSLTPENIAAAKKPNAKFEFIMMDVEDIFEPGTSLYFAWQDPVRGLWWQDNCDISEWNQTDGWHLTNASWDGWRKKITINISDLIKDSNFAASTQLNFIIGCWWKDGEDCKNINDLTITGANIYSLPTCAGNMGDYIHGYEEDGISINFQAMMWDLSDAVLAIAQDPGARLDIVFSKDLGDHTGIGLVWQDAGTERWWPEGAERGTPDGDNDMPNVYVYRNEPSKGGVYYDKQTNRLSVVLDQALETYKNSDANSPKIGFESATDAAILIYCWWNEKGGGDSVNITDLGILSANIVSGSAASVEKPVTIMLYANGEWGWQEKDYYPDSLFNGLQITKDDEYTLSYTFKSNVAMDYLQVVFVDNGKNTGGANNWGWETISDYYKPQENIAANTEYTGSITIKATETATDTSPESNRLILQAGTGTKSLPTLTFTALSIEKNN
jgi:hypothetical protein